MAKDISADQVEGGASAGDHVDGGSAEPSRLAAASVPQPPVMVAQLGGFNAPETPPQGPFVPPVPPGATSVTAGSTTAYTIGIDGTVRLPPGTVIDSVEVVGNDLHLRQPDGSLIVIVNGGVEIPLLLVGNLAFGGDVVTALLGLGQVQPAAAPAAAPGGVGSAGGEFGLPGGPIDPNPIGLTGLLPPTALHFGVPEIREIGFAFDDDLTVGENPGVVADDDDLSGGNAGGVGDDDATNLSGILSHDFGNDGPGSIGFLTTGAPSGFTYELSGDNLLILLDGTLVLTVTLDPATGAYTVIQNAPIDHSTGDNENNQNFTLTYRVSDSDGDFIDGTLNISVDDDTPTVTTNATAVVDDDNLAGGNPGGSGDDDPANVSGTLGHSFGADGGSIVFLTTGAPAGFTYELSGSTLLIKQGATLVLTVTLNTATGAYTITQNAPIDHSAGDNENNQAFTIGYRVTDGDGDTVDGALSLSVDDDTPTVTSNATAVLDDDQFTGGNPGGTGDDAVANTSGTIGFSFGADGAGSVAFLTTGAPSGFTYELSGSSLLIKQGGTLVLTVTLNTATGAYSVTQNAVIDHAAGGDENNAIFNLTYRVTDGDGDAVDGTLTINVDDDTPTVSSNAGVVVDEDDLVTGNHDAAAGDDAPANVTGTLGHSFGADGAGAVGLLQSGAPAGFTYTLSAGGTILTISQTSSGTDVLRVTVNPDTGAYQVELLNPIDHSVAGTEDNVGFTVNYSVTDGDGDSVNGTLSISVDDDLPTVAGQPRPISATVLEDGLALGSGDLSDGNREGGETTADDEASGAAGSLTGLFSAGADQPLTVKLSTSTSGLPTLFSKGDAVTYSVSGNVLTATADAGGADQRVAFTLTVNADGSWSFDLKDQLDHVDNGLNDENFALRTDAGGTTSVSAIDFSSIILGTDHDGDSVAAAPGTFTVAVQDDIPTGVVSGTVTVHVDEDNLAAGDGDLSTGIVNPDTDTDEATFSSAALSAVIANGADEPVALVLDGGVSGTVKTTGGADVKSLGDTVKWAVVDATHVIGFADTNNDGIKQAGEREVFRLTDNGNGTFTFDLKDQLDHAAASGDSGILTLDITEAFSVTDFDGDEITLGAGTIRVDVENDIPQASSGAVASIKVVEDALSTASGDLSNGIGDGDGENDEATFTSASLAALVTPGADEPIDFSLKATGINGTNVQTTGNVNVTSQGIAVKYLVVDATHIIGFADTNGNGSQDGGEREVFRLTDNGDGTFTFDLKDQIDHAPAAGETGILTLDLTGVFTATDYDGDAVTLNADSIRVDIENDIPQAASGTVASIKVVEDALSTASGDLSNGIGDGDGENDEATFTSASLAALVTPGADEPIDFSLKATGINGTNVQTTGNVNVTSQGIAVKYLVVDATHIIGFADTNGNGSQDGGEREVFRLTDNGDGTFTFDLKDQLDHGPAAGETGILTLDLTGAFTATDYDGDAVTLNADSIRVDIENDVPQAASGTVASIKVVEDALSTASGDLSNGIPDGDGENDEATFTSASLAALVTPDADEPIDFSLKATGINGANVQTTGNVNVTSLGAAVKFLVVDANNIIGFADANNDGIKQAGEREVFRLTDNNDGTFTFDLKDQLDHGPAAGETGTLTLDLTGVFTATDYDGDAVTLNADSIRVVVENDIPQAAGSATASIKVVEDALSTASGDLSNGIPDGDGENDEATFTSASLAAIVTPGADEPIDFNLKATAVNGTNVQTIGNVNVTSQGIAVKYLVADATHIVGFADTNGNGAKDIGEREVFSLTDNNDGTFTFDLKDQLDHGPAAGETGTLTLDLTGVFTATDYDGDAVTLNADSIRVVVENDVPDADNDSNTAPEGGPAVTGNVLANDAFGADEGTVGGNVRVSHVVSDNTANNAAIGSGGSAVIAGQYGSLTLNADGSYSYTPSVSIPADGVDVFTYTLIDADGDTTTATLTIGVDDINLFPDAILDTASVPEGGQVVNAAFVLDFSGSIDNNELNQQLDAVRAAGQAIFNAGAAIITIIIFSSTAADKGSFTDFASFQAAVNAMNPLEAGGVRPTGIGNNTDFTAGIQLTMSDYVPFENTNNQVFFISDGNPNEQLGTGGNSLADATKTAWATFISTHDINVTTIGVGDNINTARLQDVDLDGSGAPILVANFGALLDTLLDVVGGDTSGNVLTNDSPADGPIHIVSITVDGVVYTYNGANITPGNGDPVIAGSVLQIETNLGGHLVFHFANGGGSLAGDWTYEAPGNVPGNSPVDETFNYVIQDTNGDTANADLVITVTPSSPPDAVNDVIRTNHLTDTFSIPFSALMANDSHPNATITGVAGAVGGTVALDMVNHAVLFTPTAFALPSGSFTYILENSDGGVDTATVTLTGVNTQQVNATASGQILIGNDYALYVSISGDGQAFGGLTGADDEEIFKWNGVSFSEYYGGGELTASGEDIDALQIIPSGGILFSITGDDEKFNGVANNEADNEDIFSLFRPSDSLFSEVLYGPGDGSATWSSNNLNSLFQYSNANLVMSFDVATTIDGVTYQPYELVLYTVGSDSFSEYANEMLSSGVIDAVDILANGNVIFSMASDITLGGTLYEDSDLIRWNGTSYSKYFDGSDHGLSTADENIDSVSILGSDILVGGAGNDVLTGLGGEDLLTGGAGNDTFVLTDALAADTITDYASGDAIDLSALLDQALIQGGSQGTLADFVKLTNSGPDRVLQIDANGIAGGPAFTTVAIFSPAQPSLVHILYDNAQADVPQT